MLPDFSLQVLRSTATSLSQTFLSASHPASQLLPPTGQMEVVETNVKGEKKKLKPQLRPQHHGLRPWKNFIVLIATFPANALHSPRGRGSDFYLRYLRKKCLWIVKSFEYNIAVELWETRAALLYLHNLAAAGAAPFAFINQAWKMCEIFGKPLFGQSWLCFLIIQNNIWKTLFINEQAHASQ